MILHVNHTAPHGRLAAPASELVGALLALVEDGSVDTGLLPALRVHLDWIQYRANFREPVSVRRATDATGAPVALAEIAVDLRQAEPGRFREELARALATLGPDAADDDDRVWVDDWAPMRESIIWRFNRLFWQRLGEWERATGRGFEDALPSGKSDANHPQAVADAVADFWTLLRDMDKHGHLPAYARRSGSIASRRSTRSAAPATTRASGFCSATTRCPRSTAPTTPSPTTATP